MRKFLYDDFYDAGIHIIILGLPIWIGALRLAVSGGLTAIPVTLIVSIAGAIYSAKNVYKNKLYAHNKRIKIEIIINFIMLAISLCYTIIVLQNHITDIIDPNSIWTNYTVPVVIYSMSVIPYFVEAICVLVNDITSIDVDSNDVDSNGNCRRRNNKSYNFNLTATSRI